MWLRNITAAFADRQNPQDLEPCSAGIEICAGAGLFHRLGARLIGRRIGIVHLEVGAVDLVGPGGHQRIEYPSKLGQIALADIDSVIHLIADDLWLGRLDRTIGHRTLRLIDRIEAQIAGLDIAVGNSGPLECGDYLVHIGRIGGQRFSGSLALAGHSGAEHRKIGRPVGASLRRKRQKRVARRDNRARAELMRLSGKWRGKGGKGESQGKALHQQTPSIGRTAVRGPSFRMAELKCRFDRPCCGDRIFGAADRAANHQNTGAAVARFLGGDGALLVTHLSITWAQARDHEKAVFPLAVHTGDFLARADNPVEARFFRELSQSHHLIVGGADNSGAGHIILVKAG